MSIQLNDLLNSQKIPNLDDSEIQALVKQIQSKSEEEGPLWEIFLCLRLHAQRDEGAASASHILAEIRKQLHPRPGLCSGMQNNTNIMRQLFYPVWMVNTADTETISPLAFAPNGHKWVEEKVMDFLKSWEPSKIPPQDANNLASGDMEWEVLLALDEQSACQELAEYKQKISTGAKLEKSDFKRIYSRCSNEIQAKMTSSKEQHEKYAMGGIRACCERFLQDKPVDAYPFSNRQFVENLLSNARVGVEVDDEQSRALSRIILTIQSQIESGSFEFAVKAPFSATGSLGLAQVLNGVDSILAPVFFQYSYSLRQENAGGRLFHILGESESPMPMLLGYTLARMDLTKFLQPVLDANWKNMDGLSAWVAVELVQAGRVPEAVALVTGKGADEALKSGDKEAFARANCLLATLKRGRDYTYCGVFKYLCARLPELVPDETNLNEALNSLEKMVLADPFWEKPDLHQGESLIALAGAMLRCGEFDRARHLIEKCIKKFNPQTDAEWSVIRTQYLDAACFWYLNDKPDLMIQMLGDFLLLKCRIEGE